MSSWKVYGKIKKLLLSKSNEDRLIGVELLLVNSLELTPDQFYYLNSCAADMWYDPKVIDISDLQKYWYDKRQQEKTANKGKHTIQD